jgi:hypothetical protein
MNIPRILDEEEKTALQSEIQELKRQVETFGMEKEDHVLRVDQVQRQCMLSRANSTLKPMHRTNEWAPSER